MPWCENEECKKTGLKKEEVEFDDENKQVLCKECYEKRKGMVVLEPKLVPQDPGWPFSYGFEFTNQGGVEVHVKVGELALSLHASPQELKRLFGVS